MQFKYPETELIASILENRINRSGQSIRTVAERAGVSYSYLSKIINQKVPIPTANFLEKLALPLHLPFCLLFVSAGHFDKYTDGIMYRKSSTLLKDLYNDQDSYLITYLSFHNVEFIRALPNAVTEVEATTQWFKIYHAIQGHRQKCDMLIALLNYNNLSNYIDEAFYFFELIPSKFVKPDFTPQFANLINTFNSVLLSTVQEINDTDQPIDKIWTIYESKFEQKKREQSKSAASTTNKPKPDFEFDNYQNKGLKIIITPLGQVFGRIDFKIPSIDKAFEIAAKYQQITGLDEDSGESK